MPPANARSRSPAAGEAGGRARPAAAGRSKGAAGQRVFATVGTTRFDQLVAALDSEVSRALCSLFFAMQNLRAHATPVPPQTPAYASHTPPVHVIHLRMHTSSACLEFACMHLNAPTHAQAVQEALYERGFRCLTVQRGKSEVEPAQRSGDAAYVVTPHLTMLELLWARSTCSHCPAFLHAGVEVEVYSFKPSLAPDMQEADLIISHAGAGCIMESLRFVPPRLR